MANLTTALVAGIIGSALTAFLHYIVQDRLARKRRGEKEQRTAYVRVVQITQVVAIGEVVGTMLERFSEPFTEDCEGEGGATESRVADFESRHAAAVVLADTLQKLAKTRNKNGELKVLRTGLMAALGQMYEFGLSTAELEQLPKEAVTIYVAYTSYASAMVVSVDTIVDALVSGEASAVKPEIVFSTFETFRLLFDAAKTLRSALVVSGAVSPQEAVELQQQLVERQKHRLLAQSENAQKLVAAEKSYAKHNKDK